jgi:alpha-amylase
MAATPVICVFHNHQPVGNLPWVTEECFATAYLPFLAALERHPGVRVGLHFTGPLFEWLVATQPDYLARVRALVAAGRVEVLGGGFYEPILPVIPPRDARGQLALLRDAVADTFGAVPTGAWLAERVWEPTLPPVLADTGMRYVLLDDDAFLRTLSPAETRATFETEHDGAVVRVLPISRALRYTLPTRPVPEVLQTLRALVSEGAEVLIYAEDGERYGNWPGTYDYLYGDEAYLDTLFTALETADDLRMVLPGDYVAATPPRDRVELPATSYTEMLRWSDGNWRNFLDRYRESRLMYRKMQRVSAALPDGDAAAARHLYAGQCNCAYWYGTFGGLYLPHLRAAVYRHLLLADRATPVVPVARHAYDDGEVILLRDGALTAGFAPAQGGSLFALEDTEAAHNYLNTMGRYPLRDNPDAPVDWYPRHALLDHLLPADVTLEGLEACDFGELGDFTLGAYAAEVADGALMLRRDGGLWDGPDFVSLTIVKRVTLVDGVLTVDITLENPTDTARDITFGSEWNACISGSDFPARALELHGPETALPLTARTICVTDGVTYRDTWLGAALTVRWSTPTSTAIFPVTTPLRSLAGVEWVYQSTVALPMWRLHLPPHGAWSVTLTVTRVCESTQMSEPGGAPCAICA